MRRMRIGVHCGSVEHCFFVSKRAGLIIWPVLGAVLFAVLGGITKSSLAVDWVPGVRDVLVPAALFVVFGFQVGALVLAADGTVVRQIAKPARAAGQVTVPYYGFADGGTRLPAGSYRVLVVASNANGSGTAEAPLTINAP